MWKAISKRIDQGGETTAQNQHLYQSRLEWISRWWLSRTFEKCSSNWIVSPGKSKHIYFLKWPSARILFWFDPPLMMLDSTNDMMTGVFGDECTHHETRQGAFGRVDWFKKASRVVNSTADEWNSHDEKTEGSVSYGGRTGVTMVTPSNLPNKFIKKIQKEKQPMDCKEPLFSFNKKVNKNILFSTIMFGKWLYLKGNQYWRYMHFSLNHFRRFRVSL